MHIAGINQAGNESGNGFVDERGSIPWLQDPDDRVWSGWNVTYRDVFVLDAANRVIAVYNLTEHDLFDAADYAEFKQILVGAATR